ncbi:MAG: sulfatase [Planctomycetaceae bacterium]|nr:MAG: sulfatase [Planctomycetaceae bacterium]
MRHLVLPLLFATLASVTASAAMGAETRPNFLFILADDQAPNDFKFYDRTSTLDAPNIEALAARGMTFDSAYHMGSFSGAVCTPSRHMIMSGRTVWHLPPAPRGAETCPPELQLPQQTLPAVFNRAGYTTMRTCKQGNSYEAANKLFKIRRDATKRGGTDESGSAWHAEQVLDYLDQRESEQATEPFFIFLGFSHPHDTRDGTPELLAKYGATNHEDPDQPPALHPKQPPLPENYLAAHPFDMTHADVRDEVAVSGVWRRRDEATVRNEIGRQYACAENIDIQIGRVLARLEELGQLDNTYVIYTADHGMSIGRHGLMGKQNLYEHTWRVPLVVAGPGIAANTRVPGNVYLLDLLATFCDLADIDAPATNEGLSFRPVLEGNRSVVRDVLYGVYSGGDKPGIRSVRKGDWKLIEYEAPGRQVKETQLFHLADNAAELLVQHHDPATVALVESSPEAHQLNLADDPRHADKLTEMRELLLAEMRRLDDPYRFSNQPADDLPPLPARNAPPRRQRPANR